MMAYAGLVALQCQSECRGWRARPGDVEPGCAGLAAPESGPQSLPCLQIDRPLCRREGMHEHSIT